jgi:mannose-6-phosphate isomerase
LKQIVRKILSLPDEEVTSIYDDLRAAPAKAFGNHTYIQELLPRLAEQYHKSDPGNLIALLMMNYLVLQKGDAIYVPADGIHAYLSGDIVECMARSDNVLNTGFCPRADRDSVELFTAALSFSPKSADDAILKPKSSDKGVNGHTKVLAPPMSEFDMLVAELKSKEGETIKALQGPSIMVVTGGSGTMKADGKEFDVKEGYVFFIGYDTEIELKAESGLETHTAFCEA